MNYLCSYSTKTRPEFRLPTPRLTRHAAQSRFCVGSRLIRTRPTMDRIIPSFDKAKQTPTAGDSKARLTKKIQTNIADIGQLTKQVVRSSRSSETLQYAARSFAALEPTMDKSAACLERMSGQAAHMACQSDALEQCGQLLTECGDQIRHIVAPASTASGLSPTHTTNIQ